jgi:hypothetical protein
MPYAKGVVMEAVKDKIEAGQVATAQFTGFEPEVLAFCCEH